MSAHPLEQGNLQEIYRRFFGPLIMYKPEGYTLQEWMDSLFDAKHRDIVKMRALRDFVLPGLYWEAPLNMFQGIGYRYVSKRDTLWVRFDAREPDRVDVQFLGGQGKKDQCFTLTEREWDSVVLYLEPVEGN